MKLVQSYPITSALTCTKFKSFYFTSLLDTTKFVRICDLPQHLVEQISSIRYGEVIPSYFIRLHNEDVTLLDGYTHHFEYITTNKPLGITTVLSEQEANLIHENIQQTDNLYDLTDEELLMLRLSL